MLKSVGGGLGQPGSTSRSCLAVEPETVALSLQSPAGWRRHPFSGTVFRIKGDNTCELLGTKAAPSQ